MITELQELEDDVLFETAGLEPRFSTEVTKLANENWQLVEEEKKVHQEIAT